MKQKSLDRYLRNKKFVDNFTGKLNQMQARFYALDENLAAGKWCSPSSWAIGATQCALAIRFIIRSPDPDRTEKNLGISLKRLYYVGSAAALKAADGVKKQASQGINPQAEVNIIPNIKRFRDAVRELKQWSRERKQSKI